MRLFSSPIRFNPVDPLGAGLAEAIARERAEPERIELTEHIDAGELLRQWEAIHRDLLHNPLQGVEK